MTLQATRFCSSRRRLLAAAIVTAFSVASGGLAQALPNDAQIVAGTARLSRNGTTLTIDNSHNAIINWQKFNIAAGEAVHFNQPSASSSVLNRVLGADPSQLLGRLDSNGRVWLVNPAGILVGAGARIDTAGFVAATLNVRNEDFLAGRLNFQHTPGAASVVNQGAITTPNGGSVYLVGHAVVNQGVIRTPQGETLLAAGQTVELIDTATPGVKVEITGATGNATNLGDIVAEAGRVGVVGVLVKNSGSINASSVVREGGRIFLKASQEARVDGDGRLAASGAHGGRIEVLGESVVLTDRAHLEASGQAGGGTLLIGGDRAGRNPAVHNAEATYVGPDTRLAADAMSSGNGGKVIVWANEVTHAHARISAQGAAGDPASQGGFVETSARHLDTAGLRLKLGAGGEWLLDPYDITITTASYNNTGIPAFTPTGATSTVSASDIMAQLDAGASVTIDTTGGGTDAGDIMVNSALVKSAGTDATLTLRAHDDIIVDADITSTVGKLNVVFQADQAGSAPNGDIVINSGRTIATNGGDLTASSKSVSLSGTLNAGSGKASFQTSTAGRPIDLGTKTAGTLGFNVSELNQISASELRIGSTSAGNLGISAAITPANVTTLRLESGGTISQAAGASVDVDNLAIRALGSVTLDTEMSNVVNLAAQVGDLTHQNSDFKFKNGAALNVGHVSGLSGISIDLNGVYSSASPDGVIALVSNGNTLTQSAGALLAGKAVYADGSKIVLTNLNPTGVIAGNLVGYALGDAFEYSSSNGIQVSTVNSFTGIQTYTYSPSDNAVVLSAGATGIGQDSGATIVAVGGLSVATSGPVNLDNASNNVASLTTSGSVGHLNFNNTSNLTTHAITTSGGPINIQASGTVTVEGSQSAGAGNITLEATDLQLGDGPAITLAGGDIKLRASTPSTGAISTTSGAVSVNAGNAAVIEADSLAFTTAPSLSGGSKISYRTVSDNRSITYGAACNGADPNCLLINNVTHNSSNLVIGHELSADPDTTGNLHIDAALTNPGGRIALLSGGNISQTAAITATDLGVIAGGSATLDAGNTVSHLAAQLGGSLSLTNGPSLNVVTMTVDATSINGVTAGGPVLLQTTGASAHLTLNAPVISAASGNAVVLTSKYGFSNASSAITLTGSGSPRWLVYASDPGSVSKGGLSSAFRHYGATYATYSSPAESGNGFIYASTPGTLIVDTTLNSGSASHTYGAAPSAVFGHTFANPSIADNEDLALVTGSAVFTPTINSATAAGSYTVQYASGLASAAAYSFSTGAGLSYVINPASLIAMTVALTGSTRKTYDGAMHATLAPENYVLSGFVGGDNALVTQTNGVYQSKNVGSGLRVTAQLAVGDFLPQGATNLANYTLPTEAAGDIGIITPASLDISGLTASNKVYDASTVARVDLSAAQLGGVLTGDTVMLAGGNGRFADKNVGRDKPVEILDYRFDGVDAGNYQVVSVNPLKASITPASLDISGLTASNKVYDASTVARVDLSAVQLGGLMSDDAVALAPCSGRFDDKNVGLAKPVRHEDLKLSGVDADNYVIGRVNAMSADISPAKIVQIEGIRALDKEFDGRDKAELDLSQARLAGRIDGDDLSIAEASGRFDDPRAGADKRVDIRGITLMGSDAGNYELVSHEAVAVAHIRRPDIETLAESLLPNARVDRVVEIAGNQIAREGRADVAGAMLSPPVILHAAVRNMPLRDDGMRTIGGRVGEFGGPAADLGEDRRDARSARRDDAESSAQERSGTQRTEQKRLPLCS